MCAVTHLEMSGYANLTAKHAPLAHLGTASNTNLSRHHGIGSNFNIVRYLHEIVELNAFVHNGASHCGTVYACVCSNLNIVFYGDNAYLRNLIIAFRSWCEAKAICPNDRACMKDAVASHFAVMINNSIAIDFCARAHLGIFSDCDMRMEHHSITYLNAFCYCHKRSDVAVFANFGRGINKCQRTDADTLFLHALIKLKEFSHSFVRIVNADKCGFYFF